MKRYTALGHCATLRTKWVKWMGRYKGLWALRPGVATFFFFWFRFRFRYDTFYFFGSLNSVPVFKLFFFGITGKILIF